MCITEEGFEQLDPCYEDDGCIGPKRPNDAQLFSKQNFCSKGAVKLLYYRTNIKSLEGLATNSFINRRLLHILAHPLSCDGTTTKIIPDCSYCLEDDKVDVMDKCSGNCQLNPNTNLCERRSK